MFEKGPANAPLTEGGAAIEPYVCPGDELTIGYGCTRWFSGRDVLLTDRIRDEAHAHELLVEQLIRYEDAVRDVVTAPITSNQFSALVCFAFNCGIKGLSSSTLLRHVNASRYDDAADAFGMWLYSTSGQHKQALRGLLRRRYSEAVLWMGYDFEVACSDDAVALVRERPPNDIGTDRVLFKTPFKDVLVVAQRYPLAVTDDELVLTQPEPSPRAVAVEVAQRQPDPARSPAAAGAAPSIEKPAAASPAAGSAVAPGVVPRASPPPVPAAKTPAPQPSPPATVPAVIPAPVGTKAKSPNTVAPDAVPYKIDANAGLKPLEESDRAKGYWYQQAGIGIIRLGSLGVFGTTLQGGSQVLQGDPVLSNIVLTGVVLGGIAVGGYIVKTYGDWKRKRGEARATQGLY